MSDFSTTASLRVELDDGSLRSARQAVEDELSGDPVTVTADVSGRPGSARGGVTGGGTGPAGGLSEQTTSLNEITSFWEENIPLNETRNDLLRELLEAQERTARESGGSRLRTIGSSLLGIAGGGMALSGMASMAVGASDLINIDSKITPDADDLVQIGEEMVVGAADLVNIGGLLNTDASDLLSVGTALTVGVGSLLTVGQPLTTPAADLLTIGATMGVPASDLITIGSLLAVPASDLITIGSAMTVGAGSLLDVSAWTVGASTLISIGTGIAASKLITGTVNINDFIGGQGIVDQLIGGAAAQGAFTLDMLEGAGEFAADNAGGIAAAGGVGGVAKMLASRFPAGAAGGVALTREQYRQGEARTKRFGNWFSDKIGIEQPYESPGSRGGSTSSSSNQRSNQARESRQQRTEITVDQTVDFDTRPLERELEQLNQEVFSRLDDLEQQFEEMRRRR